MTAAIAFLTGILSVHAGQWLLFRIAGARVTAWHRVADLDHEAAMARKQSSAAGEIVEINPTAHSANGCAIVVRYPEPVGFRLRQMVRVSVLEGK